MEVIPQVPRCSSKSAREIDPPQGSQAQWNFRLSDDKAWGMRRITSGPKCGVTRSRLVGPSEF